MKKTIYILLTLVLLLQLCACRVRTTLLAPESTDAPTIENMTALATPSPATPPPATADPVSTPEPTQPPATAEPEMPEPEPQPTEPVPSEPPETEPPAEPLTSEPGGPTEETEDSERREYAQDTSGEVTPDAETPLAVPTEAPEDTDAPAPISGDGAPINTEFDDADKTAIEIIPAEEAEELGVNENGEVADRMQTYYLTLLDSRLGALFECKRLYVYWETDEDHRTVHKSEREHQLILGSGAYDVSAKLLEENLTVDDGWVCRKNPDVVVKVMDGGSLDTAAAQALYIELAARPGWSELPAVRDGRVVVLSSRLMETQAGQIAAMVYLAKLMYPDQMEDVDADEALRALTEESSGSAYSGVYAFTM